MAHVEMVGVWRKFQRGEIHDILRDLIPALARAFGRIAEMTLRQIPVVVVSHQLDRIATLCTSAILLKESTVAMRGTPAECIARYVHESAQVETSGQEGSDLPVVVRSVRLGTTDPVKSGDDSVSPCMDRFAPGHQTMAASWASGSAPPRPGKRYTPTTPHRVVLGTTKAL